MIQIFMKLLLILASFDYLAFSCKDRSERRIETQRLLHTNVNGYIEIVGKHGEIIEVKSMHISCKSGKFSEANNYIGLVLYQYYGQNEWTLNGKRIRAGYIYLVKSDSLMKYSNNGTIHAKAYYDLFKTDLPPPGKLVATGIVFENKTWTQNSRTFNEVQTRYTCEGVTEFEIVKKAIENWNQGGGQNFYPKGQNCLD